MFFLNLGFPALVTEQRFAALYCVTLHGGTHTRRRSCFTPRTYRTQSSTMPHIDSIRVVHVHATILYAVGRLPAHRLLRLLALFDHDVSILFENLHQLVAVWVQEFGESFIQRIHDVIDESHLHSVNIIRHQQTRSSAVADKPRDAPPQCRTAVRTLL